MRLYTFILFSVFLTSTTLYSQSVGTQQEVRFFTDHVDLFNNNNIYDYPIPDNYQGSPYYSSSFLIGSIYLKSELLDGNVALRYNAFADEIEFKKSDDKNSAETFAIIKSEDVHVVINKETFVFKATKGYFIVIYDGTNFSLVKKIKKKFYPFKKAATSLTNDVPAIFIDEETYYIAANDGSLTEFSGSKNKKLKLFENNYNEAKSYVKEKNLDLNKERDMKRLIIYLDKIKDAKQQ